MKRELLLLSIAALATQAFAEQTTTCFKKNWPLPSTVELTKLEGGLCEGKKSFRNMTREGWYLKDVVIKPNKEGLDYTYTFTDTNPVAITQQQKQEVATKEINEAKAEKKEIEAQAQEAVKKAEDKATVASPKEQVKPIAKAEQTQQKKITSFITKQLVKKEVLPLYPQIIKLQNVTDTQATINIGNLKVGQSGIIKHYYENGQAMVIADAYVISSNDSQSVVKFLPFKGLKQNAIPTTSRKPVEGDELTLNYLYDSSLLIAPDATSFRAARLKFHKQNFQHSDMFASFLKVEGFALPSRNLIQEFAIQEDLGTIFIIIDYKIYILDTKTFSILDVRNITYRAETEQMPFYTRVEEIETSLENKDWLDWVSFSWLKDFVSDDSEKTDDEIIFGSDPETKKLLASYSKYYQQILGVNLDR